MIDPVVHLPEGVPPLTSYYIYLTAGCNLACHHCWISPSFQPNGGTGGHLDYDLLKLAIEEGLPLGLRNIKLTGGEPLLHPDFIGIIDLIRENELNLTIETNGTLMTPSLAHYLKEKSTLSHISISLDGVTSVTHDPFRGVRGSFDRACKGISNLVEAGLHPQVIMSLHAENLDEIESLVRWSEKTGCGSVKFNLLQPSGRGELMKERGEWLDIEVLLRLGQWIEKELQPSVSIPVFYSWPMAFHGINHLLRSQGEVCNIEHILGVLATGHLAMCGIGTQEKDLIYGQLGKDKVREVWTYNPILLQVRSIIMTEHLEGICSQCVHQKLCKGYCLAQNYYASKHLKDPFWFCQMADLRGLFPLSRKR